MVDAASVPHMKDEDRMRLIQTWQRQAYGDDLPVKKATKADLMMLGIGVNTV